MGVHEKTKRMANRLLSVWVIVVILLGQCISVSADSGGGTPCAACTLIFQLMLNLMAIDSAQFDHVVLNYCTTLPPHYADPCIRFANSLGEQLIEYVGTHASSDAICHSLGVCSNATCNLFPSADTTNLPQLDIPENLNLKTDNIWQWIADFIDKWTSQHVPPLDFDGDKFVSSTEALRGRDWRGRDCDGLSPLVYPGRKTSGFPDVIDQDCNGISGRDHLGRSYENQFCDPAQRRGLIALGDSATAHFRIPEQFLTAADINKTTYNHFLYWALNEFDWPHRSWGTGHLNDTTGDCDGPLDSIYLNMLRRNRCNFRDFQNIGVNGARTGSMAPPGIIASMARTTVDHPALVIYALVGNDVCHPAHEFSSMTTPQEFEQNVLASLQYLDGTLPKGSFVVMIGLAQGEVLWHAMHNRTHPVGCTYEEMYDYLNCLEVSPCWGWMNSNATVRALTSIRARQLSNVYPKIIAENTFNNFEMAYYPFPLPEAMDVWTAMGGQVWQLIEPSDGFHPSQQANALIGQILFDKLSKEHPSAVGAVNPHNDEIKSLFPDQGGY